MNTMNLKNITPGSTVTMGYATFTVEAIRANDALCVVSARYSDGTRSEFVRPALTTVTVH